jgi:hypothetical protein
MMNISLVSVRAGLYEAGSPPTEERKGILSQLLIGLGRGEEGRGRGDVLKTRGCNAAVGIIWRRWSRDPLLAHETYP